MWIDQQQRNRRALLQQLGGETELPGYAPPGGPVRGVPGPDDTIDLRPVPQNQTEIAPPDFSRPPDWWTAGGSTPRTYGGTGSLPPWTPPTSTTPPPVPGSGSRTPPPGTPPSSTGLGARGAFVRNAPGDIYEPQGKPSTGAPFVPERATGTPSYSGALQPNAPGTPPYEPQGQPSTEPPFKPQQATIIGPDGKPIPPNSAGLPGGTGGPGPYQTPATGSTVRAKDQFMVDAQAAKARGEYNADWVRRWVAAHPEWEIQDGPDPLIRMKQEFLDRLEPGQISTWQDVIRDSGGVNDVQFINADGGGGGGDHTGLGGGGGGAYNPLLHGAGGGQSDIVARILAAIEQLQRGALMGGLG